MNDEVRCNATVSGKRCDWRGSKQERLEHAEGSGHYLCRLCSKSLRNDEPTCCNDCVNRTRDALIGIRDIDLEPAIEATALHPGTLPGGNALVMAADGSVASPQTPDQYTRPVVSEATAHIVRGEIVGTDQTVHWWKLDRARNVRERQQFTVSTTHPPFIEERKTPDGREHVRDHWPSDPTPVLAVLEANARDWRSEFGHRVSDSIATVENTIGYLLTWLPLAARTHPCFEEFANEIQALHSQLAHVTGQANDPAEADAPCFDCGGKLIRDYRPPIPTQRRREGNAYEGLPDNWTCRRCKREYAPSEYWLAVRSFLEAQAEAS